MFKTNKSMFQFLYLQLFKVFLNLKVATLAHIKKIKVA